MLRADAQPLYPEGFVSPTWTNFDADRRVQYWDYKRRCPVHLTSRMNTIKQPTSLPNRILFGLLSGVFVYFGMEAGAGATLEERRTMLAYACLFASALFATSLPNALIPDTLISFHQVVNTPPEQLFRYQLKRWIPWIASVQLPLFLIAFYDPGAYSTAIGEKSVLLLANLATVNGLGLYCFLFYFDIGAASQRWQEGAAGGWYDRLIAFNPQFHLPLPRGLVPAITATTRLFMLGIAVVIGQQYLARDAGMLHIFWPAGLILAWALYRLQADRRSFDPAYYHTNAFYREIFQRGSLRAAERDALSYDAVYWVPPRWRSHAWMNLVQLDRVLPIGRFFAIGMLILWVLVWRDVKPVYVTTYILLLLTLKNIASLVLSRHDLNPPAFQYQFQSRFDWSLTRFFIDVRWTLPLFISMIVLGWLAPSFSIQEAGVWTLVDLALSFVFAWTITLAIAIQSRERLHG
jgi:hypothetical protein